MAFAFRAYRMSPSVRRSLTGIRFSKKQLAGMKMIWEHEVWNTCLDQDLWPEIGKGSRRRGIPEEKRAEEEGPEGEEGEAKEEDE